MNRVAIVVLVAVLGILFGLTCGPKAFRFCHGMLRSPVLSQTQLGQVDNGAMEVKFRAEGVDRCSLLLAFPQGGYLGDVSGQIDFWRGGQLALRLRVSHDRLVPCSWLSDQLLNAYIIENPDSADKRNLTAYLKPKSDYNVVVNLTNAPQGSTIWLTSCAPPRL